MAEGTARGLHRFPQGIHQSRMEGRAIMTRTHSRIAAPMAALGFLALLAGCGSDSETVTKRTVIQDQPQTVRTETTTTTVEED
jgi:hypothetical protein|tara:strand:- start:159 stop:407 length:249 start_codon:yes stop_codon:yes gene_type:complete